MSIATISQDAIVAPLPFTSRGQSTIISVHNDRLLYAHGRTIYLQSLSDRADCLEYRGHAHETRVARHSPNGKYVASGDAAGWVRVWEPNPSSGFKLQGEWPVLSGSVHDLAWDPTSQLLLVAGDGRDRYVRVLNVETGSTQAELVGITKAVNSAAFGPDKMAVVVSDDFSTSIYSGQSFKLEMSFKAHSRFAQVVQFSRNMEFFATAGSDGKVVAAFA